MTTQACASLVEKGDQDRFLAVMAAPVQARARLFVLYAFNLEVARAPWVSEQPLIAEMRLQFWRDVLADPKPRAHEVAGPLRQIIDESGLDSNVLDCGLSVGPAVWPTTCAPCRSLRRVVVCPSSMVGRRR